MIAKSLLSAIALTLSLASASSIASDVGLPRGLCFELENGISVPVDCSKPPKWLFSTEPVYKMSERQLEELISKFGGKPKKTWTDLGMDKPFDPKDVGMLRNDFYKPYGTQPTLIR